MLLKHFARSKNEEIYPLVVGYYQCPSMNTYGPHVRDYHILHFVLSGKGVLINDRGTHPVSKGEVFLIREGEVTTYIADKDEPWEYTWIGFKGSRTSLFDSGPDVYKIPAGLDMKLLDYVKRDENSTDIFSSILYELMYHLFAIGSEAPEDERIRLVHRHIKYYYMDDITIGELASTFGFERSYLYRIFKSRYGLSPKEYLTQVRLEKARWLLERGYSISECADLIGYSDAFALSKAYKKHYGVSPSNDKISAKK